MPGRFDLSRLSRCVHRPGCVCCGASLGSRVSPAAERSHLHTSAPPALPALPVSARDYHRQVAAWLGAFHATPPNTSHTSHQQTRRCACTAARSGATLTSSGTDLRQSRGSASLGADRPMEAAQPANGLQHTTAGFATAAPQGPPPSEPRQGEALTSA